MSEADQLDLAAAKIIALEHELKATKKRMWALGSEADALEAKLEEIVAWARTPGGPVSKHGDIYADGLRVAKKHVLRLALVSFKK